MTRYKMGGESRLIGFDSLASWRHAGVDDVEYEPVIIGFGALLTSFFYLDVQKEPLKLPGCSFSWFLVLTPRDA